MITKENLAKAIREVPISRTYPEYVEALADKVISVFPTWIPVEERLPDPKEYDWVLVNVKFEEDGTYGVPHIAELREGKWYGDDDYPLSALECEVTHWMPLPEYPRSDENG